jgi:processive 1,2-diacylglycerol beta-glucosyltransferase
MERFLVAADVVVGKSGGLTVAEVLACGRPLLVTRTLQGQESFNVRFLERHGIGRLVRTDDELVSQVREWLASPDALSVIHARAWAAGRRDGAARAAEVTLELVAAAGPTQVARRQGLR